MAGVKISNLPAIAVPAMTDVFPVSQAGVTYKETITQLAALLNISSVTVPGIQNQTYTYVTDTGAVNAYVGTLTPAPAAYQAGQRFDMLISTTNTGPSTVNFNGLGAEAITFTNGDSLTAGALLAGMIAQFENDGTNFQLLNPANVLLSFNSISVQEITATGAFAYTPTAGTKFAVFELQGGGGGSGGTTGAAGQSAMSGAGGGGAYQRILVSGAANLAAITGSVGIAGTAGAAGNNPGGAGGNTTLTINGGTQWVAGGGGAGAGTTSSAAGQVSGVGGSRGTNTLGTNGTSMVAIEGSGGSYGATFGNVAYFSSSIAGNSFMSSGGADQSVTGRPYGGGAAGAFNFTGADAVGIAGGQGVVTITEYVAI